MKDIDVKTGKCVKVARLGSTLGWLIMDKHLTVRAIGKTGTVINPVPGHGEEVWFVDHHDGTAGAYRFEELEPLQFTVIGLWDETGVVYAQGRIRV